MNRFRRMLLVAILGSLGMPVLAATPAGQARPTTEQRAGTTRAGTAGTQPGRRAGTVGRAGTAGRAGTIGTRAGRTRRGTLRRRAAHGGRKYTRRANMRRERRGVLSPQGRVRIQRQGPRRYPNLGYRSAPRRGRRVGGGR
jgi:hypothetical protein